MLPALRNGAMRRCLTSIISLAALMGLGEAALPDVHHHEVATGAVVAGTLAVSADMPVPDDASHGHQHTCHCVHGHMSGIPAAVATALEGPGVHESAPDLTAAATSHPVAPPLGPPRA